MMRENEKLPLWYTETEAPIPADSEAYSPALPRRNGSRRKQMEKNQGTETKKEKHSCPVCGAALMEWETVCSSCGNTIAAEETERIPIREKSEYGAPIYDPMRE